MDSTEEYTCLSLCSGYGGLELGLRRACPDVRTVAYVEVEAFAAANLVSKMETGLLDAAPVWTDIKTFNAEPFRDRIHIITAGYPCQGESVAGKRLGKADPRWLWPDIKRIIETVRPVWFFGENVDGHLTLGFSEVYRGLRNMGYRVEAGLFSAAECGAPHRRQRLFILAHNTNSGCKTGKSKQKRKSAPGEHGPKLADTECAGEGLRIVKRTQTGIRRNRSAIGDKNLADTTSERIQGAEPEGTASANGQTDEPCYGRWPARPGQQQYEWEEPRVVDYSSKPITRRQTRNIKINSRRETLQKRQRPDGSVNIESTSRNKTKRQTQSRLGMSANGYSCGLGKSRSRVDELRLLGNGVVPQQAEKAFRELMRLFE